MSKKLSVLYISNSINTIIKILLGIISGRYVFTGPYRIIIDICNKCSLGCIMCPVYSPLIPDTERKNQTWQEMYIPINKFRELLQDAISINVKSIWICGGGEPFLHPDVFRMIKMVKSSGLECAIFTNGIHIDRAKIISLLKMGLDRIILSMHAGDASTYQKIHPQAKDDHFRRIVDWLEYLRFLKERNKKTLPKIWFRTVVTRYNYNKINKIISFAIRHRVDFIEFKIDHSGIIKKELLMDKFQKAELVANLNRYKKELHIPNNINSFISTLVRKDVYFKNRNRLNISQTTRKMFCYKPWYNSAILADGTVPGCTYNHKIIGNINKEKFSKIWYSQKYFDFRKNLSCGPCSAAALSKPLDFIHKIIFFNR